MCGSYRSIRVLRHVSAQFGAHLACRVGMEESVPVVGTSGSYVSAGGGRPWTTATTRASTSRSGNALLRCTQIRRAV